MGDEKLRQLIARFRVSVSERVPEMEQAYQALEQAFQSDEEWIGSESFGRLRHHAHQLAGSSGSLGFPILGKAASALDVMMQGILERQNGGSGLFDWPQVGLLYRRMTNKISTLDTVESLLLQGGNAFASFDLPPEEREKALGLLSVGNEEGQALERGLRPFGMSLFRAENVSPVELVGSKAVTLLVDFETLSDEGKVILDHWKSFDVPAVAAGWSGDLEKRVQAYRCGAEGYLLYPLDPVDVVDVVEDWLQRKTRRGERVLVVDDDPPMLAMVEFVLQAAGMEVFSLADPARTLDILGQFRPDLLIIDRWMPGFSGFEVAAAIRQQRVFTSLPVIFLTGDDSSHGRREALELGGDDYVSKPIDPDQFVSLVRGRAARARQIRSLIVRDSLTGLLNHTAFREELESQVSRAGRTSEPLALALIDLDHFKAVNDTWGHQAGDAVLKALARMFHQRLRRYDHYGRLGGEEFAILLPATMIEQAHKVLEDLLAGFRSIHHHSAKGEFTVTFSAGIAAFPTFSRADDLVRAADDALYRAKHSGRNCIHVATLDP